MNITLSTNAFLKISPTPDTIIYNAYISDQGKKYKNSDLLSLRMVSLLEKTFGYKENLYFNSIVQCIDYMNNDSQYSFLKDIDVQVNVPTIPNKFFKNIFFAASLFSKHFKLHASLLNSSRCHAITSNNQIIIGTELLRKIEGDFLEILNKDISKEETARLLFFHEIGHLYEYAHRKNFIKEISTLPQLSPEFFSLLKRVDKIDSSEILGIHNTIIEQKYRDIKSISPIDELFLANFVVLKQEMYADVVSILLNRNYNITYKNDTNINIALNSLIKARQKEHSESVKYYSEIEEFLDIKSEFLNTKLLVQSCEHLTSPALEILKDNLEELSPDTKLSEKEIHHMALSCTIQGLQRLMYVIMHIDSKLCSQIASLMSHEENELLLTESAIQKKMKNGLSPQWLIKAEDTLLSIDRKDKKIEKTMVEVFNKILKNDVYREEKNDLVNATKKTKGIR